MVSVHHRGNRGQGGLRGHIYIILFKHLNKTPFKWSLFFAKYCTCFHCTHFLMSVLPLSWLISAWKNFPELWTTGNIWKKGTQEENSNFGYFDKVPVPRGPYSCDTHCQQLTDREFFFIEKKNVEITVASSSKCIYMTKASFHNQVAIGSSLTYFYSSRPMPSLAEEVPGPASGKKDNADMIHVK